MLQKIIKNILLIVLVLCAGTRANAQVIPTDSALLIIMESDVLLPMLIDSAIKNSGEIRRVDNSILLWKETTESNKKSIFSGVSLLSSYNYGTAGDITVGKDNTATNSFSSYRSNKGDRYNFGVNVQIPLTFIIARKNLIRTSELQAKMVEGERDNAKLYIKGEIIRMYQDMKLAQKLILASGKGKETSFVNYSLAEKLFIQGNGDIEQLARLHDIYSKASMEFDTNVNRFQTSYLQLQEYAGVKLSNLIQKLK